MATCKKIPQRPAGDCSPATEHSQLQVTGPGANQTIGRRTRGANGHGKKRMELSGRAWASGANCSGSPPEKNHGDDNCSAREEIREGSVRAQAMVGVDGERTTSAGRRLAGGGRTTCSGGYPSEPSKAVAFVVPSSGTGSDDIDGGEWVGKDCGGEARQAMASRRRSTKQSKAAANRGRRRKKVEEEGGGEALLPAGGGAAGGSDRRKTEGEEHRSVGEKTWSGEEKQDEARHILNKI